MKLPNAQDLRDLLDLIEEKAKKYTGNGDGPMRGAAIQEQIWNLRMDMKKKGVEYNIMIMNLDDRFDAFLDNEQVYEFRSVTYYGKPYGIWLFKEGTFEKYGIGSDENWGFYGNFRREGEPVKLFRSPWKLWLGNYYGLPRRVVFEDPN